MAQDIFSRDGQDFGGAFAADAASITFAQGEIAGGGGVGLITQNLTFSYNQAVTRIFEVGSNLTFLVAGRASGQAGVARILGPRKIQTAFYKKYGNVCNAATNHIDFSAESACSVSSNAGRGSYTSGVYAFTLRSVIITGLNVGVSAGDMLINEQLQMMFIALNLNSGR
jgi:hypothetical protein